MYSDRQTLANSVAPDQVPQNAASDQSTLFVTHSAILHTHRQQNQLVEEKYEQGVNI